MKVTRALAATDDLHDLISPFWEKDSRHSLRFILTAYNKKARWKVSLAGNVAAAAHRQVIRIGFKLVKRKQVYENEVKLPMLQLVAELTSFGKHDATQSVADAESQSVLNNVDKECLAQA